MQRAIRQFIEHELRHYHETKSELLLIREELSGKTDNSECYGRSNIPGDPTGQKAIKLLSNRRLAQMERTVGAIDTVIAGLNDSQLKFVQLRYWDEPRQLTDAGIAQQIGIDTRTLYRWADAALLAIAVEMNVIDGPDVKAIVSKRCQF